MEKVFQCSAKRKAKISGRTALAEAKAESRSITRGRSKGPLDEDTKIRETIAKG